MDEWEKVYRANLHAAILKNPDDYSGSDAPLKTAIEIASKFRELVERVGIRRLNIDGPAFRATAKHFGINNTYKAWEPFFAARKG